MNNKKLVECYNREGMTKDLDKSCLSTHSWKKIEERL